MRSLVHSSCIELSKWITQAAPANINLVCCLGAHLTASSISCKPTDCIANTRHQLTSPANSKTHCYPSHTDAGYLRVSCHYSPGSLDWVSNTRHPRSQQYSSSNPALYRQRRRQTEASIQMASRGTSKACSRFHRCPRT